MVFEHLLLSSISKKPPLGLTLASTIRELFLDRFEVELSCPSVEVLKEFQQFPLRPGVILTIAGEFAGMISRERFWKYMSRPYSLELFSGRSIQNLYEFLRVDIMQLDGNTSIVEAARYSLQRSPELMTEPIVVILAPQDYRLLDFHQLLVAQTQILQLTTQLLQESSQKLEVANLELQRLAALDGLTGIANRRGFDNYLLQTLQQSMRSQLPLSLLLADVDFFKPYNDYYGHLSGDHCLVQVATTLQNSVKGSGDLVARYGGEEFGIILPNCERNAAVKIAETICNNIRDLQIPHHRSQVSDRVTLSLGGISMIPKEGDTPQTLIQAADRALYEAKQTGRDRCIFQPI
ncbi:GGDEF domain-containing protein [Spirulina sp. 06S082]|nr:GGDEF domain-containing protein [Spirulina sp. 06S082]